MNHSLRLASILAAVGVLGLSACAWDRGEYRGARNGSYDRGGVEQRSGHDRDGRPCEQQARVGDSHHDEDCRPRIR
jgi:hypothetical protein